MLPQPSLLRLIVTIEESVNFKIHILLIQGQLSGIWAAQDAIHLEPIDAKICVSTTEASLVIFVFIRKLRKA